MTELFGKILLPWQFIGVSNRSVLANKFSELQGENNYIF